MSALLNIQRKLLKDGRSVDEVPSFELKKYLFSYINFFSVIEAQTICKCFIGLFIMSLILKRSRSTLSQCQQKSCCGGVGWRVHFLQMCKEIRLYFLQF